MIKALIFNPCGEFLEEFLINELPVPLSQFISDITERGNTLLFLDSIKLANHSAVVTMKKAKAEPNIPFDEFWQAYGKRLDRSKAEKKWNALKDKERTAIMADIPKYIASLRDLQFQKHATSYLNGRCWEDEHIPITSSANQGKIGKTFDAVNEANRKINEAGGYYTYNDLKNS